jgi:hypothetical protein
MRVVIMQPTYLPWLGYFDLIDQSDLFIFLDDVQFERQSWQQRNRIKTSSGLQWLTVPIKRRFPQFIHEVEVIAGNDFPTHHLRAIEQNYRKAPYFDQYFPLFNQLLSETPRLLCDLNISLIEWLCAAFGLAPRFIRSSTLNVAGKRSALLVDICQQVGCDTYLSPAGSTDYLMSEHSVFEDAGIQVLLHRYDHPIYHQLYQPFIPFACALDLLFNEGDQSLAVIRSGRQESARLADIL